MSVFLAAWLISYLIYRLKKLDQLDNPIRKYDEPRTVSP
jgi:hypothetical protein